MNIQSIEWKNFNSYGNTIQSINFKKDKPSLYLLLGGNGNGKSTISEVITYSLFGKVDNKNKSDLVNRINKNLWCRIKLISKGKYIEITRGISPGLLSVIIDSEPYDTSGNSNVQTYLETEIYEIPYQVFKNILVLSVNDFRSFLTMSNSDKRNIIDRLFGLSIVNQMRDRVKQERKSLKISIKTINDELRVISESIESIEHKIKELAKTNESDKIKLAKEYVEKIKELNESKKSIELLLDKIKSKRIEVKDVLDNKSRESSLINSELVQINKKLKLYSNSKCPTCSSDITGTSHKKIKETLVEKELDLTEEKIIIDSKIKQTSNILDKIQTKLKELNDSSIRSNMRINQYKGEVVKLQNNLKENNEKYLKDLIEENRDKNKNRYSKKIKDQNNDNFLLIVENILGEDGIKNMAMKSILPPLNQSIKNMGNQIHLPYTIKFDEKFDCIIKAIGEEVRPKSMSTGERKKVDFIIIIALLKMLKLRYPSINILFLDEIFSSIDSSGIYEIIKILKETTQENNLNTWVINHSELPLELFDKRVEAIREGGFSTIIIEDVS